jgi:hypothetical protein
MADTPDSGGQMLSLEEIAAYHEDVVSCLKYYFNELSAYSAERFFAYTPDERAKELRRRVEETSLRSILIVLASVEARFRVDYEDRCRYRLKDNLSRSFRAIYKNRKRKVKLEQDIFEAWKTHRAESRLRIGELRTAFKFRHWLAHGRYWQPKIGRNFDFESVFDLAAAVSQKLFGDEAVSA